MRTIINKMGNYLSENISLKVIGPRDITKLNPFCVFMCGGVVVSEFIPDFNFLEHEYLLK
jgi:hypothetical protein